MRNRGLSGRWRHRIGIVGAGSIALDVHVPSLLGLGATIAWIADVSPVALRRAQRRYGETTLQLSGPEDMLPADVVLLAVPVGVRMPYHDELSRRGCRVYVEKPFARNIAEAKEIRALYQPGRLACGYQRRYYPGTRTVMDLVRDGTLGAIERIVVREGAVTKATGIASDFRDDPRLSGGGVLMDLGCHGIDLAVQMTGATSSRLSDCRLIYDGDVDRDAQLRAELSGGNTTAELVMEVSWLRDLGHAFTVEFEHGVADCGARAGDAVEISASSQARGVPQRTTVPSVWTTMSTAWADLLSGEENSVPSGLNPDTALPGVSLIEEIYSRTRS